MSKYKVGDELICLPGFTGGEDGHDQNYSHGGFGYVPGLVFTVTNITSVYGLDGEKNGSIIYWGNETYGCGGIHERAVEMFDQVHRPWLDSKLIFKFA